MPTIIALLVKFICKINLSGGKNLYKIKLKAYRYRLVYEVEDLSITVFVLSIGKRERSEVYKKALARSAN